MKNKPLQQEETPMNDEYEFPIPPKLQPWLDAQQKQQPHRYYYILNNGKITPATFLEWAHWFENPTNRQIENTITEDVTISTVFLGINHDFSFTDLAKKRPILFETMVFGGTHDQFQWRYSTLGEAKQGHYELVTAVQENRQPHMQWGQEGFWNLFREMFE
jgi:hypothetical protein